VKKRKKKEESECNLYVGSTFKHESGKQRTCGPWSFIALLHQKKENELHIKEGK